MAAVCEWEQKALEDACALLSAIPVTLMKAFLRTGKLYTEEGSGDCWVYHAEMFTDHFLNREYLTLNGPTRLAKCPNKVTPHSSVQIWGFYSVLCLLTYVVWSKSLKPSTSYLKALVTPETKVVLSEELLWLLNLRRHRVEPAPEETGKENSITALMNFVTKLNMLRAGAEPEAPGFKYSTVSFLVSVFAAVHSNPFQSVKHIKKARLHSEEWWNVNQVHLLKYTFTLLPICYIVFTPLHLFGNFIWFRQIKKKNADNWPDQYISRRIV